MERNDLLGLYLIFKYNTRTHIHLIDQFQNQIYSYTGGSRTKIRAYLSSWSPWFQLDLLIRYFGLF